MTKSELITLLDNIGMTPSRKLGQNFLVDQNMIECIIRDVAPIVGEKVLEIGPGTGVLTSKLLENGVDLISVEFDYRLAKYIRETYGELANFTLIENDAVKVDYEELLSGVDFRCIANLPYAISTIFMMKLLELNNPPLAIYVMLQQEMGERLVAKPRTKAYGSLSVRLQACYDVKIARKVSAQCFCPPPEVGSILLDAKRRDNFYDPKFRHELEILSRLAFSQRRKQVLKIIAKEYDRQDLVTAFELFAVKLTARAEEITVDQFVEITTYLLKRRSERENS